MDYLCFLTYQLRGLFLHSHVIHFALRYRRKHPLQIIDITAASISFRQKQLLV